MVAAWPSDVSLAPWTKNRMPLGVPASAMPGPYTSGAAAAPPPSIWACPLPLPADRARRHPRLCRARFLSAGPACSSLRSSGRSSPPSAQTDAGIGVFFFVNAVASVGGSIGGGLLTERIGRRVVLTVAVALMAIGLAALAIVPTWTLFLVAAVPLGLGFGAIDGGMNGLVLDLYPEGRGRALNLLHLSFSLGALASPLFVGRLVDAGIAWQTVILGTALAASRSRSCSASSACRPAGMSTPRNECRADRPGPAADPAGGRDRLLRRGRDRRQQLAGPLPRDGVADARDLGVGPVLGVPRARAPRQCAARRPVRPCLVCGGRALVAAAAAWSPRSSVPSLPVSIVLFGVVGFAFGPVYPLIVAVAGDRYPARSAAVTGFLSGTAVIGAIVYPPVMGFVSVGAGLGAAMLGAAVLVLACGVVLVVVARRPGRGRRRRPPGPGPRLTTRAPRPLRYAGSGACRSCSSSAISSALVAP